MRRHKNYTKEEKRLIDLDAYNYRRRLSYREKRKDIVHEKMKEFKIAYLELCKEHRCYIGGSMQSIHYAELMSEINIPPAFRPL